jgi:subtilisin family serine protease
VKKRASSQRPLQQRVLASYQTEGEATLTGGEGLAVEEIGGTSLPVASVEVTRKTLPALAAEPNVVAVLPNQRIQLIRPTAVNYDKLVYQEKKDRLTWGLKRLEIPKVWEVTRGQTINVAVLDTGVYGDHPALHGRVKDFIVVDPLGRRIKVNPSFDSGSHGTHVCGTIAGGTTSDGVAIGVAPGANLLVGGVLVGAATMHSLLEGISWAIERGADIINMSLGFRYYEPYFEQVCDMLIDQYGILPVVAIGNENHGSTSSPGNAQSSLSVGAVEKGPAKRLDVAFFSGGASLVFPKNPAKGQINKPDVVAPGVQVFSSIPPEKTPKGTLEYTYMDGTSMATPHVAGVAALLMAAKPKAPIRDILGAIKETAQHPEGTDLRPDNRWGYGMVQPWEALQAL